MQTVTLRRAYQDRKANTRNINRESASRAMSRLCERIGLENARLHDLRKCVTTWLRERGTSPDICDLILHHARGGVTGAFYDFATLEGPVREALQRWADHVERAGAGKGSDNVRTLVRA